MFFSLSLCSLSDFSIFHFFCQLVSLFLLSQSFSFFSFLFSLYCLYLSSFFRSFSLSLICLSLFLLVISIFFSLLLYLSFFISIFLLPSLPVSRECVSVYACVRAWCPRRDSCQLKAVIHIVTMVTSFNVICVLYLRYLHGTASSVPVNIIWKNTAFLWGFFLIC